MGIMVDLLLAVPIGIIYNMIVHESANVFNDKFTYKNRVQRNLLMIFGGGLIGLVIAMFCLSNSTSSVALRYGLYFGSILLLAHSVMYNWEIMQNDTRIIVMILILGVLIWYSYSSRQENNKIAHIKYKSKKDKTGDYDDYVNSDGLKLSSLLPMTYYEQYKTSYEGNYDDGNYDDEDEIVRLR